MPKTKDKLRILFLGDIVGRPGRRTATLGIAEYKAAKKIDYVIANGENLASGNGMTMETYQEMREAGVDYFTSGNHIWQRGFGEHLDDPNLAVLRPANYPPTSTGRGYEIITIGESRILLLNLIGRVFMKDEVADPFAVANDIVTHYAGDIIIIDFHAEATSEKIALGFYLDGRATAVLGTHTHVQTADERILPEGTAFISDIGMCGPINSVLGVKKEIIIEKFLTALPKSHKVASGDGIFNAVAITINLKTKKAEKIERISKVYPA